MNPWPGTGNYQPRRSNVRKRLAKGCTVEPMDAIQDRLVLVRAGALDEVLELARLAAERLPQDDPLTFALKGTIGQIRSGVLIEP